MHDVSTMEKVGEIMRNSTDNSLPCGFRVAHRAATGNNESWIVETVKVTTTQHTIRDLLAYTTYDIQVEALNDACSETFSPAVKVTTNEKAPSAPPQNLTVAVVTYFDVVLKWLPPPKDKRNGRMLQYSVTAWQIVSLSNSSATESPVIFGNYFHDNTSSEQQGLFQGLQSDANYKIIIIASNSAGSSPPSFPVYFKTFQGPIMPSTSQTNTGDMLSSTQELTSIPTILNETQKDKEKGAKNNIVIALAVAAAVALVSVLLITAYIFYRRQKRGGAFPKETLGGSIYNNRVTTSQARHLPNTEHADLYLVPVDNHKRWRQQKQQQHIKTSTDQSYYNSEEIMLQKRSNVSHISNLCVDDYSYAAPVDLLSTSNRNEEEISPQFAQHNPIYETSEGAESQDEKIDREAHHRIQENPIYTAVSAEISFPKQTKYKLTEKPIPAKRNKTTVTKPDSPPALIGHGESSKIEVFLQTEPDYDVLEGPDPSTPDALNNASANLYHVLYSTDSREHSKGEGLSEYDVLWNSSNKPEPDTRSKHKAQKTPTQQTAVDTPDLYEKLWLSSTDDDPRQRNVEDNSYDNTYDTVGDSIA